MSTLESLLEAMHLSSDSDMDTAPAVSGANVRVVIHADYQGGDIVLPGDPTQVISVAANPVLLFGLTLWLVGSVGLFFSRVIKAMLSREREYLADAGGVQFTRNPEALAGALDQIRANYSWVAHRHAEDVSHLFIADAHGFLTEPLFATHPPLEQRIARIAPDFTADPYRARRMQSTGQSGNVFSPWYSSFAERWAKVQYVEIPTKRDAINAAHTLRLSTGQ